MQDPVAEVLAQRATLDSGFAAGVIISVLLHGGLTAAAVYAALLVDTNAFVASAVALLLLGGYYAATDGVLTALAAALLPAQASASGLSAVATVANVGRLVASLVFGLLWARVGLSAATAFYLAALVLAIAIAGGVLGVRARSIARGDDLRL